MHTCVVHPCPPSHVWEGGYPGPPSHVGGGNQVLLPMSGGVPSPPSSSPSQLVLPLGGREGYPALLPAVLPSWSFLLGGDPALLPAVLLAILPSWSFLFGGSPVHHRKGHIGPLSVNSIQSVQLYSEGGPQCIMGKVTWDPCLFCSTLFRRGVPSAQCWI